MNLIFIYGPPAVGKLTVAKQLEKLTDYKIFHNHITIDFALPIYEYGTKEFIEFNERLRLQFFKEAIKANAYAIISFTLNRVFTEWYKNKGKKFSNFAYYEKNNKYLWGSSFKKSS